jgi:lysophospholipase L1-like esterase
MTIICVFGDSIGEGFYDDLGGWVARLARMLQAPSDDYRIFNCSISGASTKDTLLRFETELLARSPDLILIALGTNDCWIDENATPLVSIEEFQANIEQLIQISIDNNATPLVIGALRVDEKRAQPVSWKTDIFYSNKNIQRYNDTSRHVCKKLGITFIDTFEMLLDEDLIDGVHPNTYGHEKLANAIKKLLPL